MSKIPWVEKYRPKTPDEIIGNERAKTQFDKWLSNWHSGSKPALLFGPPGIGKTTLVHAMAKKHDLELIELNASDTRTRDAIMKIAGSASTEMSLSIFTSNKKGMLIFMDEIDGISSREDTGGLDAIIKIVRGTRAPVVLAANDPYDRKLTSLRYVCEMIRFYRVRSSSIVAYLKKICKIEGIMADEEALEIIAEKSDGDVRSAINDLQFYAEGKAHLTADDVLHLSRRDRELDVFETLRAIFSALDSQAIDRVMRSSQIPIASMDRIDLLSTINENLPFHYSDPDEMAKAYEALSKADVFFGRIVKFQKWELLPYISQLLSAGIAMTKREMAYQKYNFPPSKIVMASRMREKNAILNETLSRISSKFHVSKKVANIEIIPFLRILINSPLSQDLVKWLNLSKDEINLLTSEEETLV